MTSIRQLDTTDVPEQLLTDIRRLLDEAFGDDFSEDDWAHTLGGTHVVVEDAGGVVAHAAVVPRTILVGERPFRTGYVEGVATAPSRQGEGLGAMAMRELARVIRSDYELAVLSTGAHGFYERLGWERWSGPSWVRDGDTTVRTEEEDDGLMVLRFGPSAGVDLTDAITCEARPGDPW